MWRRPIHARDRYQAHKLTSGEGAGGADVSVERYDLAEGRAKARCDALQGVALSHQHKLTHVNDIASFDAPRLPVALWTRDVLVQCPQLEPVDTVQARDIQKRLPASHSVQALRHTVLDAHPGLAALGDGSRAIHSLEACFACKPSQFLGRRKREEPLHRVAAPPHLLRRQRTPNPAHAPPPSHAVYIKNHLQKHDASRRGGALTECVWCWK
jgi:hypothetical protein